MVHQDRTPFSLRSLAMPIVAAGEPAPEFELDDLEGKTIVLKDVLTLYPVLVVFFRSDCGLCQWALPQLARYEWTFKGGDVEVYYVTPDTPAIALDTLRAHRLLDLHALVDPGSEVAKAYGVEQLPAAVFIGPDGNVVVTAEGWDTDGYVAVGRALKEQMAWIRGPLFGATWTGEPCPAR